MQCHPFVDALRWKCMSEQDFYGALSVLFHCHELTPTTSCKTVNLFIILKFLLDSASQIRKMPQRRDQKDPFDLSFMRKMARSCGDASKTLLGRSATLSKMSFYSLRISFINWRSVVGTCSCSQIKMTWALWINLKGIWLSCDVDNGSWWRFSALTINCVAAVIRERLRPLFAFPPLFDRQNTVTWDVVIWRTYSAGATSKICTRLPWPSLMGISTRLPSQR